MVLLPHRTATLLLAMSMGVLAPPALAQDVTFQLALASDYRFRGLSLSNGAPVIQGGVDFEQGKWRAEIWGSSRADGRAEGREIDLYVARTGSAGSIGYEAGARVYLVDGAAAYVEGTAQLSRQLGPVRVDAELSYAPPQARLGEALYSAISLSVSPSRALTLSAQTGVEDGPFYGTKYDWEIRSVFVAKTVTLSAAILQARGRMLTPDERAAAAVFSIQVEL